MKLNQLAAKCILQIREELERMLDKTIAGDNVAAEDIRGEDDITKSIVRYFREEQPVLRFEAANGRNAVARFVTYKQKGRTEKERGDLAVVFDMRSEPDEI